MPESVTISWDEWEAMQKRQEQLGEIVRHASNWEISFRRNRLSQARRCVSFIDELLLADAVDRILRAPGHRWADEQAKEQP